MSDAILQAVEERRDELVALVQELVSYRSENPKLLIGAEPQEAGREQETACQSAIAVQLADLGAEVDRFEALPGARTWWERSAARAAAAP